MQGISEYRPNATVVVAPYTPLTIFCSTVEYILWKLNGKTVNNWDRDDGFELVSLSDSTDNEVTRYNHTVRLQARLRNNNTKVECLGDPDSERYLRQIGMTVLVISGGEYDEAVLYIGKVHTHTS